MALGWRRALSCPEGMDNLPENTGMHLERCKGLNSNPWTAVSALKIKDYLSKPHRILSFLPKIQHVDLEITGNATGIQDLCPGIQDLSTE